MTLDCTQNEKSGGKCRECEWHRSMNAKRKGVRVPGGFGKCTRPGGVCDFVEPAPGIGGAKSEWRPKHGR